ncbi:DUF2569 domain-containing protein [Paenibacillus thiaminolyticus]|uniref:DUF2569 domain-containing protein n=1 Tax=Paenibacillus thiaminolyticus TaxID=49283 RepID=UPI003D26F6B0
MNANPPAGSPGEPPRPLQPLGPSYQGLSGWLIVIQIALWWSFISMLISMFSEIIPFYQSDTWSLLTTPESDNPMLPVLIICETVANLLISMLLIMVLILFYRKKKLLPKMLIVLYICSILWTFVNTYLVSLTPGGLDDYSRMKIFSLLVLRPIFKITWIIYFIRSKRVKATFVN